MPQPSPVILLAEDLTPSDAASARSGATSWASARPAAGRPRTRRSSRARWGFRPWSARGRRCCTSRKAPRRSWTATTASSYIDPQRGGPRRGARRRRARSPTCATPSTGRATSRRSPPTACASRWSPTPAWPKEAAQAVEAGGEGIGLMRSEFLFLERDTPPSRGRAVRGLPRAVAARLHGLPLIVRTLDIGGDKAVPYLDMPAEENPFLGVRGIRLCLAHPEDCSGRSCGRSSAPPRTGRCKIMYPDDRHAWRTCARRWRSPRRCGRSWAPSGWRSAS